MFLTAQLLKTKTRMTITHEKIKDNVISNGLTFFFRKYLCSADSSLFRIIVLPIGILVLVSAILFAGFGPSFEILSNYSVRFVHVNVTDPVTNITRLDYVRTCLDKNKSMCIVNLTFGDVLFVLLIEAILLFVIYLYTILIIWLGISLFDLMSGFCCAKNGEEQQPQPQSQQHCFIFCNKVCACAHSYDEKHQICCYINNKKVDDFSRCLEEFVPRLGYFVCIVFGLYVVGIIHILAWTGGQYNFTTGQCNDNSKIGVCDTDNPRLHNERLVDYFALEMLAILCIEFLWFGIIGLVALVLFIVENFKKQFNSQIQEDVDPNKAKIARETKIGKETFVKIGKPKLVIGKDNV